MILDVHRSLINWSGESFGGELRQDRSGLAAQRTVRTVRNTFHLHGRGLRNIWPISSPLPIAMISIPLHRRPSSMRSSRPSIRLSMEMAVRAAPCSTRCFVVPAFCACVTLPVSAGLLHSIDSYMESLAAYQQGNPVAVVEQLVDALELALVVGRLVAMRIDAVMEEWTQRFTERKGSSIYRAASFGGAAGCEHRVCGRAAGYHAARFAEPCE